MLAFQVLCGSLYYQVGIILTVFMLGLAIGAWAGGRSGAGERTRLFGLGLGMAGFSAALPFVLRLLDPSYSSARSDWSDLAVKAFVALLAFVLAALAGAQFPLANRIEFDNSASALSRLYTADFMGACLGALLASTLLVPLLGVGGLCALCALLNLVAAFSILPAGRLSRA